MTNYVYHDVTALCEKEGREITVEVKYAATHMSGSLYPRYKALEPQCSHMGKCLLIGQDQCSVLKKARLENPI